MANIGKLAAVVSADAAPFFTALDKVKSAAKDTAAGIGSAFEGIGDTVTDLFGVGDLIGGGLSFAGLFAGAIAAQEHIIELAETADDWGVSLEKIRGLEAMTGGDLKLVESGVLKLTKTLGEASLGSRQAARGFEMLGLNVEELSALPTERVLGQVADRLNAVENAHARNAAASAIFGKNFAAMTPLIEGGSAALDEWGKKVDGVTEKEVAHAKATRAVMREMKARSQGVIETHLSEALFGTMNVARAFGELLQGNDPIAFLRAENERMKKLKEDAAKTDVKGNLAETQFAEAVAALEEKLVRERDALLGVGSAADQLAEKYSKLPGGEAALERARALEQETAAIKDRIAAEKQLDDLVKKTNEANRWNGPFDEFLNEIDNLGRLAARDKGGINETVHELARVKAFEKLAASMPKEPGYRAPSAMLASGNEAMQTIEAFRNQGAAAKDANQRVQQILEQARDYQRDIERNTREVAAALKKQAVLVEKIP